ncbi:MAG: NUDIX domain-containing protein [Candidatus Protochlamydia sp.]|nr:NUDIX domain-containing protein [Candidatus Protochlamydia sp.]
MKKEFTATVYILKEDKVLLIKHPKFQKWLPPGGHVEPNESPVEAAKREVKEETGFDIEIISQENLWISRWNAKSFDRPYLCLLEEIPAFKDKMAHYHMDMIYIAKLATDQPPTSSELPFEWFNRSALESLIPDVDIFVETLQIIDHLFTTFSVIPATI